MKPGVYLGRKVIQSPVAVIYPDKNPHEDYHIETKFNDMESSGTCPKEGLKDLILDLNNQEYNVILGRTLNGENRPLPEDLAKELGEI